MNGGMNLHKQGLFRGKNQGIDQVLTCSLRSTRIPTKMHDGRLLRNDVLHWDKEQHSILSNEYETI